jgi:hypothetical protein
MRKRRTGNSRRCALALALLVAATPLWGGPGKQKKRSADYALVAGTVFRESGLSLPGAEVEIVAAAPAGFKFRKQQAVSDARGEFAFRVPAAEMKYRVSAKARGYSAQEQEVSVTGFERVDVFFRLEPASK